MDSLRKAPYIALPFSYLLPRVPLEILVERERPHAGEQCVALCVELQSENEDKREMMQGTHRSYLADASCCGNHQHAWWSSVTCVQKLLNFIGGSNKIP
jgi:hypothetical protein